MNGGAMPRARAWRPATTGGFKLAQHRQVRRDVLPTKADEHETRLEQP
jgi:hypothetical protein